MNFDEQHPIPENQYWSTKDWWCRPWSIVLFGILSTISVFYFIKIKLLFFLYLLLVLLWWILFLYVAPRIYK
tara:strand:+ start:1666 stop:1881 length:216 start_codon:yes stop_codon:yes gene_type:complete